MKNFKIFWELTWPSKPSWTGGRTHCPAQMDQDHVDVWGDVIKPTPEVSSKTQTHACRRLERTVMRLCLTLLPAADGACMFLLMQHLVKEPFL